jgi:hypothetical protein
MGWEVPLDRYPDTYNGQPLAYAGPPPRRTTCRST